MPCRDKFSLAPGKRRIVDKNVHPNRGWIDVHELKRRAFLAIDQGFADVNFLKAGESNNVAGGRMFDFDLLQSGVGKQRGDGGPFPPTITVNADNRVASSDAPADNSSERNSSQIIAVIQVRHEHLKKWLA